MTKLRNQSEFTHMAEVGGENGMDGLERVGGIRICDPFESARI
jgi:hypothetical protein